MKILTGFVFLISIVLFLSVYVSPNYFPYVGLLPFLIPVAWLTNVFLLLVLILSWRRLALLPLIALLIGYKFILITFQWNTKDSTAEGLKVLSYNAHLFDYKRGPNGEFDSNAFTWLQEHPAEVKVFQEFYQDYTSASRNSIKLLGNGYNHFYQIIEGNPEKRSYGLAIFSKYPIVNEGKVFDNNRNNGAIFADILVNKDTIRIYNAHLESMNIETRMLENYEDIKVKYRQTIGKLHRGSLTRSQQLTVLLEHMNNSPHPIILLGDLNELPYSHTYFKLSEKLVNAFEKAGQGFEFTYNKILFFLRIDHIFASPELKPVYFNTHNEVDYSDHYPVTATFTWDGFDP
jgi:endonuclease/exonuclease/phosphatase (EEP) superfamily protein YafD